MHWSPWTGSLLFFKSTLLYSCHHSVLLLFAGFLGKNCEVDVDACALADSTCPQEMECVDLPQGLRYTCRVPCPLNLQVSSNWWNWSLLPSMHPIAWFPISIKKYTGCQDEVSHLAWKRVSNITSAASVASVFHSWTETRLLEDWATRLTNTYYPANTP